LCGDTIGENQRVFFAKSEIVCLEVLETWSKGKSRAKYYDDCFRNFDPFSHKNLSEGYHLQDERRSWGEH